MTLLSSKAVLVVAAAAAAAASAQPNYMIGHPDMTYFVCVCEPMCNAGIILVSTRVGALCLLFLRQCDLLSIVGVEELRRVVVCAGIVRAGIVGGMLLGHISPERGARSVLINGRRNDKGIVVSHVPYVLVVVRGAGRAIGYASGIGSLSSRGVNDISVLALLTYGRGDRGIARRRARHVAVA